MTHPRSTRMRRRHTLSTRPRRSRMRRGRCTRRARTLRAHRRTSLTRSWSCPWADFLAGPCARPGVGPWARLGMSRSSSSLAIGRAQGQDRTYPEAVHERPTAQPFGQAGVAHGPTQPRYQRTPTSRPCTTTRRSTTSAAATWTLCARRIRIRIDCCSGFFSLSVPLRFDCAFEVDVRVPNY